MGKSILNVMGFAPLTCREYLRDIEASLIERIRRMLREGQGDQMIKDGMGLTSGACCLAHNVPGEDDL